MKTIFNIMLRILVSPFVFALIFIKYNLHAILHLIIFLKNGGEWVSYSSKKEGQTIQDIYLEIKSQRNEKL